METTPGWKWTKHGVSVKASYSRAIKYFAHGVPRPFLVKESGLIFFLQHAAWLVPLLIAGMLISLEIGYRVGISTDKGYPGAEREGVGAIEAAMFGLLGLLLAFTFSAAQGRFEKRRDLAVQESNAIGTAYLRLDLLSPAAQEPLRKSFREYLEARIGVYQAIPDMEKVLKELDRAGWLQREIWSQAQEAVRAENWTPAAILLIPALNQMIDITSERTLMALAHTPDTIFLLLLSLALFCAAMAGYGLSRSPTRNWFHRIVFVMIVSLTMFVVVDLEYPRVGLIRLDTADQFLIQLRDLMK
jgi:hypothetical protein